MGEANPGERRAALSLQQLVGAAERLYAGRDRGRGIDWLSHVEQARDRLLRRPITPGPAMIRSRTVKGKQRDTVLLDSPDRLLHEAVRPLLDRAIEPLLAGSAHGYRRGRGVRTAATAVATLLAGGARYVLRTDVAAFFPSVDWGVLDALLSEVLSPELAELCGALVRAPIRGEAPYSRSRGLLLGLPLSPLLANLYLAGVDSAVEAAGVGYVRYADDLLLAAKKPAVLASGRAALQSGLAARRLRLSAAKTRLIRYEGEPFAYLGGTVDHRGFYERVRPRSPSEPAPETPHSLSGLPGRRTRTLYITTPRTYLRMRQGLLQVVQGPEVLRELPLHRVDRILVLVGCSFSSGFASDCIARGIPVLFFVNRGRAYGSLVAGSMPNPLRLRAQYGLAADPDRRLRLARRIVEAKISAFLRRGSRRGLSASVCQELRTLRRKAGRAKSSGTLRGLEGNATRAWYRAMAEWVDGTGFAFPKRSRRPPRDPFNSLLSFTYSLLVGEMQLSILAHGLDPHPGFLHELQRAAPALAFDLVDPFRPLIGDSFVLGLVGRKQVDPDAFEHRSRGAVYMSPETRRTVLEAWESFISRRQGGGRAAATPRAHIDALVGRYLAVVLGESDDLEVPMTPPPMATSLEALGREDG